MSVDDRGAAKREITEGLGSVGRIRIMAELAKNPNETLTKYAIIAATGLRRVDLKTGLAHLVAIGWVKEYKSIYPKYQINLDNPRARQFANFLRETGFI